MKLYISSCHVIAKILRIISATVLLAGLFSSYAVPAQHDETTGPGTSDSAGSKAATTP